MPHYDVNEQEMAQLAAKLAKMTHAPQVIALSGTLGSGKTSFSRAFIRALTGDSHLPVPSPTFTLVQEYASPKGRIHHFDLYRLEAVGELEELGFMEALEDGIVLIEWPELGEHLLPRDSWHVVIAGDGERRQVRIEGTRL